MRLIDADALKKDLTRFYDNEVTAKRLIDEQPTIEPQRIKGRWEIIEDWDGDELYRCSECLSMFTLIDGTPEDNDYNFCPCCGADMRGEKE